MQIDVKKPITEGQVVSAWKNGSPVLIVEYRGSIAERLEWRDKTTGKVLTADILRHTVEISQDGQTSAMTVNERQGEGFVAKDYKSPITKGQRCALWFRRFEVIRGLTTCDGVLQLISDAGK